MSFVRFQKDLNITLLGASKGIAQLCHAAVLQAIASPGVCTSSIWMGRIEQRSRIKAKLRRQMQKIAPKSQRPRFSSYFSGSNNKATALCCCPLFSPGKPCARNRSHTTSLQCNQFSVCFRTVQNFTDVYARYQKLNMRHIMSSPGTNATDREKESGTDRHREGDRGRGTVSKRRPSQRKTEVKLDCAAFLWLLIAFINRKMNDERHDVSVCVCECV